MFSNRNCLIIIWIRYKNALHYPFSQVCCLISAIVEAGMEFTFSNKAQDQGFRREKNHLTLYMFLSIINSAVTILKYASVLELADRHVWGACVEWRMGSSPITRTIRQYPDELLYGSFGYFFTSSFRFCGHLELPAYPYSICITELQPFFILQRWVLVFNNSLHFPAVTRM